MHAVECPVSGDEVAKPIFAVAGLIDERVRSDGISTVACRRMAIAVPFTHPDFPTDRDESVESGRGTHCAVMTRRAGRWSRRRRWAAA
jgi:hypothetical protein